MQSIRGLWVAPCCNVVASQQHSDFLSYLGTAAVLWVIGSQLSEINRRGSPAGSKQGQSAGWGTQRLCCAVRGCKHMQWFPFHGVVVASNRSVVCMVPEGC